MRIARGKVERVTDPGARDALEAVLDSMGHLHLMLMKHESATAKSLFDLEGRVHSVLFNT